MRFINTFILSAALAMLFTNPAAGTPGEEKIAGGDVTTADWMKEAARKHLEASIPPGVVEWEIEDIRLPDPDRLPPDFDSFTVTGSDRQYRANGFRLSFNFRKNGKVIKKIHVSGKLKTLADIVVLKTTAAPGTVLTEEMMAVERKPVRLPMDDFCTDLAHIQGRQATRSIRAGEPVRKSFLSAVPDVREGEMVMVTAENRNIKVTVRGIAKKDGRLGELIPVMNLRSNKKVFGRITAPGRVFVAF